MADLDYAGLAAKLGDGVRRIEGSEVAEAASFCGLFGVVLGGAREWQNTANLITEGAVLQEEEKIRRKYLNRTFTTEKSLRMLRYHASKEVHGLRMLKVCTTSIKTCFAFGLISAAYVTVEQGSRALRGEDDAWNSVCSGSACGSVIGMRWMSLRGAGVGAIAGGLSSFPFGYAKTLASSLEQASGEVGKEASALDVDVVEATPQAKDEPKKPGLWGKLVKRFRG